MIYKCFVSVSLYYTYMSSRAKHPLIIDRVANFIAAILVKLTRQGIYHKAI